MNTRSVMRLLEANQDPRGIRHWQALHPEPGALESCGIGLTRLRKMAREIGRDHDLAQQLWQLDHYEAKVISLLIDDPKKFSRSQAEIQVEQLEHGMLAHVFASCGATLAKTPYVVDLATSWIKSEHVRRRECGHGLLYEISKNKKKSAPDDAWFLEQVTHIRATQAEEENAVRLAMAAALMGVGKRNKALNAAALVAAREMGPVPGTPGCDPFDAVKHLTSAYLTKKLGS